MLADDLPNRLGVRPDGLAYDDEGLPPAVVVGVPDKASCERDVILGSHPVLNLLTHDAERL